MASGTISGPEAGSYGSMLELSWGGKEPVRLNDGGARTFLEDGDKVTMCAVAAQEGVRVGFGGQRCYPWCFELQNFNYPLLFIGLLNCSFSGNYQTIMY